MNKQKKSKKWVKWVIIVAILAGIIGFVVVSSQSAMKAMEQTTLENKTVMVEKGNLNLLAQASGMLSSVTEESLLAPWTAEVDQVLIEVNDTVKANDLLVVFSEQGVEDEIANLQRQLLDLDNQIRNTDKSKSSYLSSPVSGRIKAIYAAPGHSLDATIHNSGGLMLISPDDLMEISFTSEAEITTGQEVKIVIEDKEFTSTIRTWQAGQGTVVIIDSGDKIVPYPGQGKILTLEGSELGEGEVKVRNPFYVLAGEGVTSKVRVNVNNRVSVGDTLIDLKDSVYSLSYQQLLKNRQDLAEDLQEKIILKQKLSIYAPYDGVVKTINAVEGQGLSKKSIVLTIENLENLELIVPVDELDIAKVALGQGVDVSVDALPDQKIKGTVQSISSVGTSANNVTRYDVTVELEPSEGLKLNMSARADIQVDSRENVLLVPVGAIVDVDGEKFVTKVLDPASPEALKDPGEQIKVETGLSNGVMIEILSGLEVGDFVIDTTVRGQLDNIFTGPNGGRPNQRNSDN